MVSIAKSFNTLDSVLPDNIVKLYECPWTITLAIDHAKMVLSWYEHLSDEDRPPKEIWMNDSKLKNWFDRRKNRKGKQYDQYIEVDQ